VHLAFEYTFAAENKAKKIDATPVKKFLSISQKYTAENRRGKQ
jgi:hypothetical protein